MRVDNVRKDIIEFEDKDVILCYSDHSETFTEMETGKSISVNHGWFVIWKDKWKAENLPDEMVKHIWDM